MAIGRNINRADTNEHRVRMMKAISEGEVPIKDLVEILQLSYSTITHHAEVLERNRLAKLRTRHHKVYLGLPIRYPILIENEDQRKLVVLLGESFTNMNGQNYPGLNRTELAKRFDVSATSINWHLGSLKDDGFLRDEVKLGRVSLVSTVDLFKFDPKGYTFYAKDGKPFYGKA